jgi:hypothetical protein
MIVVWPILCGIAAAQAPTYFQGAIAIERPQLVYGNDVGDPWIRIFYCLFTRKVRFRATGDFADAAPLDSSLAFRSIPVSSRIFERIESGDRAIDPLYPSFLTALGTERLFEEPRYSEFVKASADALEQKTQRSPAARALFESDLWAAYDLIFQHRDRIEGERPERLLTLLARMIRKVALTAEEARRLPDNYTAGVKNGTLPDLYSERSPWIEVVWHDGRLHDSGANYRRSTRIFLRPAPNVKDRQEFLESFREHNGPHAPLEAVALVTRSLLIDNRGALTGAGISTEVQTREFSYGSDGHVIKTGISDFELSRKALVTAPSSSGLVSQNESAPAYLAAFGNDYTFASPIGAADGRQRELAILGSLRARCAGCHGPNSVALFTFNAHDNHEGTIRILDKSKDEHAQYVIERKTALESWKSLAARWR